MNPYSAVLLATAVINLILAVFTLRQIRSVGAAELSFLLITLTLYCFGYAFELSSTSLKDILLWLKVEYLGISFMPALIILFAIKYTDRGHLLKHWMIIILLTLSGITLVLHFTNFKGLFYRDFQLEGSGSFVVAQFTKGPWYWIHQIYLNIMLLASIGLYTVRVRQSRGARKSSALLLLVASLVPWFVYLVYITGHSPHHIDLNPFSFSVIGILYAVGIFRYQMLDFFPIALEHVFNSLDQGVIILNARKKLVAYNDAAAVILPGLKRNMIGRSIDTQLSLYPAVSELIRDRDAGETEVEIIHDPMSKHFHVSFHPVIRKGVRIPGYTITLNEITQSKQKEQKLIEKGKNLELQNITKDKFLAIIAHDLRNPFHILINLSEIILRHAEKGDYQSVSRIAGVLHNTARSTYNLLQNLLEWALIQKSGLQLNIQKIKIKELILDEIEEQKQVLKQKQITLKHRVNNKLFLYGDEHMVKTIIRNLISNAVKYSYPKGIISVTATAREGTVTFVVKDQGIGMTHEETKLLFSMDTNFTRKGTSSEPGSGLGLALCREFVQLHGGTIWVKSLPGKGSSFSFSLPVMHG